MNNPVDWHEWGDKAFDEARSRDVPVLLSVGYAACHWCHVMAHESFEDPETAEQMNQLFVNIKVDREERPDVDSIYMEAVQAMSGRGGWPMTVWLDPEGKPFFAGTYFPYEPLHGMPSFREVMSTVSTAWVERRDDVIDQADRLVAAISEDIPTGTVPDTETVRIAYEQIALQFDGVYGGFGGAPKFPQQPVLEFLLRVTGEDWAAQAPRMIERSLERMASGGIHDQLGGGFARYSVDDRWLVPHFEKMLYDNAQLARLYLWAGIEFDRDDFVSVSRATLDYLLRDLRHLEGGFFSSEDADSEGVEGKFYVWSIDEIRSLLGNEAESAIAFYGVTEDGNFEGDNILTNAGGEPTVELADSRQILLDARSLRIRPGLDDKVIAAWNGLAIRALAEAGAALDDTRYLQAARESARFVLDNLVEDGRLMRSWRDGQTSTPGFLDDHASLALGLYSLYGATGEIEWYNEAIWLMEQIDRFTNVDGGFFSTPEDAPSLIKRPIDIIDNPLPSGNALAAEALLLTALYTGEMAQRHRAEEALRSAGPHIGRYPSMVASHLAVSHSMTKTKELAIVGPDWKSLARVFWSRFRPHAVVAGSEANEDHVPLLKDRYQPGTTRAYVCKGFVCDLPTSDPLVLRDLLE